MFYFRGAILSRWSERKWAWGGGSGAKNGLLGQPRIARNALRKGTGMIGLGLGICFFTFDGDLDAKHTIPDVASHTDRRPRADKTRQKQRGGLTGFGAVWCLGGFLLPIMLGPQGSEEGCQHFYTHVRWIVFLQAAGMSVHRAVLVILGLCLSNRFCGILFLPAFRVGRVCLFTTASNEVQSGSGVGKIVGACAKLPGLRIEAGLVGGQIDDVFCWFLGFRAGFFVGMAKICSKKGRGRRRIWGHILRAR
ncbi:hypothetical protein EV126DRAFT_411009, partial [Verticillium dahliae]